MLSFCLEIYDPISGFKVGCNAHHSNNVLTFFLVACREFRLIKMDRIFAATSLQGEQPSRLHEKRKTKRRYRNVSLSFILTCTTWAVLSSKNPSNDHPKTQHLTCTVCSVVHNFKKTACRASRWGPCLVLNPSAKNSAPLKKCDMDE